jgi:hypothetical protein
MGMAKFMNERNDFGLMWDVGYGSGMDHMGKDYEYEADVFWSRYFNPNFSTLLGYRFTNDEDSEDRFIGGVRYRLPGLVWTGLTLDSEGDARLEVTKALQRRIRHQYRVRLVCGTRLRGFEKFRTHCRLRRITRLRRRHQLPLLRKQTTNQ